MTGKVRRVLVVGRDAELWMSALALHRAVGDAGVRVEAVELPSRLSPADLYAGLPPLRAFFRLIGLGSRDVLRVCRGLPVLGQRFVGWSGAQPSFIHGYDVQRPAISDIDFLQFWVKARAEGLPIPLEEFSPAAVAAKSGRVADETGGGETLTSLSHGFHLHAQSYSRGLRQLAVDRAIPIHAAPSVTADRSGDRIRGVRLDDGQILDADFFVDASGSEAVLIGQLPHAEFESWDRHFPCNRMIAAWGPPVSEYPPFAEIAAFAAGWIGLYPLQNGTAARVVYDASRTPDQDAVNAIVRTTGMPLSGATPPLPIRAGMRSRQWIGNCVAIGAAAAGLEPLDATELHLVQIGISHAIALFPADRHEMPEAQAYNASLERHILHLRDFQLAHYKLNDRKGDPFWDEIRAKPVPDSLDTRIALFGSRGVVAAEESETFQTQNWSSIFVGHGLIPARHAPQVDSVPAEERQQKLRRLLNVIADEVRAMPTVRQYLGGTGAAR